VLGFRLTIGTGTAAATGDSTGGVAVCIGADADAGADEDDSADTAEGGHSRTTTDTVPSEPEKISYKTTPRRLSKLGLQLQLRMCMLACF
jgi:hypothetical protein